MNAHTLTPESKNNSRYIRALIVLKGVKQNMLAKNAGVSEAFLAQVISGTRRGIKKKGLFVRQIIADSLDMTVEELWSSEKKGDQP